MSCCDDAIVYINNTTAGKNAATATVTAVSTSMGTTINGISVGDTIAADGGSIGPSVQSAGGSRGAAAGTIKIQMAGDDTVFALNYNFQPKNRYGKCPCKSGGTANPSSDSSFKWKVTPVKGSHGGCTLSFAVS